MVTITRGTSRLVIALPSLGVAVKVPILVPSKYERNEVCKTVSDFARELSIVAKHPLETLRASEYDKWHWVKFTGGRLVRGITKISFTEGVKANWREWWYYLTASAQVRPLLNPTYFSFLGFCTIVKYRRPSRKVNSVREAFKKALGRHYLGDGHHFQHADNFSGLEEGNVIVLDYGSPLMWQILNERAWHLSQGIDLDLARLAIEFRHKGALRRLSRKG